MLGELKDKCTTELWRSRRDVVGVPHVVCFYWLVAVGTEV